MADRYELQRFVDAQAGVIDRVRLELAEGRKQTHWMWFVFPQVAGLGSSAMARRYAIASLDEARAYLAHPVLGPRLVECTRLVNAVHDRPLIDVLGSIDALKIHSSMTLFSEAAGDGGVFAAALDLHFAGRRDAATLARLGD